MDKTTEMSSNMLWIAGSNSKWKLPNAKPAGFWAGFWHGIIAPLVFIVSLLNKDLGIYETINNGRWYNFGFLIGIGPHVGATKRASS